MILARWAIFILNHAYYMCVCFFLKSPKELNKQSSNAQRTHDRFECTGTGAVQWIVLQCNAMHKKEATKTQHTRHRRQVKPDWDRHFTFFFFIFFELYFILYVGWLFFSCCPYAERRHTSLIFKHIFQALHMCSVRTKYPLVSFEFLLLLFGLVWFGCYCCCRLCVLFRFKKKV